jgi:hypothetical protein
MGIATIGVTRRLVNGTGKIADENHLSLNVHQGVARDQLVMGCVIRRVMSLRARTIKTIAQFLLNVAQDVLHKNLEMEFAMPNAMSEPANSIYRTVKNFRLS